MLRRIPGAVGAVSLVALATLVIGAAPAVATPRPSGATSTVALAAHFAVAAKPFVSAVPAIKGSVAVGKTLAASPGTWSPAPAKFIYQWFRSGKAIAKATGAKYVLTPADLDAKITVRVTASKPGYRTAGRMSKPTAPVAVGAFSAAPAPKIAGAATVGDILTAQPGTWKPKPAKVTYQWYRSGKPIAKAIGAKYKLVAADAGTTITVRVTASSTGYKAIAKTSVATAKVAKAAPPVSLKPPTPAEPYYANCTAARQAGAAPIRRGEPGYRPALDRDNDGIACE
jgi:hypothetical protein